MNLDRFTAIILFLSAALAPIAFFYFDDIPSHYSGKSFVAMCVLCLILEITFIASAVYYWEQKPNEQDHSIY